MKVIFLLLFMMCATQLQAQEKKTKNVVLISIDGYRWQEIFKGPDSALLANKKYRKQDSTTAFAKFWGKDENERRKKMMPFFWNTIAKNGQLYGNRDLGNTVNLRNKYWFSYPGRSETITGYYDPKINSNDYANNPNENVLEFIHKKKGFTGKVVTFAGWAPVSKIVNRDRNKMLLINPFEKVKGDKLSEAQVLANEIQDYIPNYFGTSVRWDVGTFALAKTYIAANHPKLTFIDFADPDDLGHAGQYDYYLDAANYIDAMIASLWNTMQADPFYKNNTTFIICTDHGRGVGSKWTGHGPSAEHSNETWLAVLGPDSKALGEVNTRTEIYQDQIAQTLANLLGYEFETDHPVGAAIPSVLKR